MNTYGLGGKVAVITGGASGIGRSCAHTLARSGADISIWDLDQGALDVVVKELDAFECKVHSAVVDVSDSAAVDAATLAGPAPPRGAVTRSASASIPVAIMAARVRYRAQCSRFPTRTSSCRRRA